MKVMRYDLYPVNTFPICVFLPNNFIFEFLCFWSLWVIPQFQATVLADRNAAPLQGAENVGYSGMSCFLCSYPMAGLSQPLFE